MGEVPERPAVIPDFWPRRAPGPPGRHRGLRRTRRAPACPVRRRTARDASGSPPAVGAGLASTTPRRSSEASSRPSTSSPCTWSKAGSTASTSSGTMSGCAASVSATGGRRGVAGPGQIRDEHGERLGSSLHVARQLLEQRTRRRQTPPPARAAAPPGRVPPRWPGPRRAARDRRRAPWLAPRDLPLTAPDTGVRGSRRAARHAGPVGSPRGNGFRRGPVAPLRGDDAREVLERRVGRVRAEPGLDGSPGAVHVSPLERRLDLLDRHGGILARGRPRCSETQAQDTHEPQDPRERAGDGHRLTSRAG